MTTMNFKKKRCTVQRFFNGLFVSPSRITVLSYRLTDDKLALTSGPECISYEGNILPSVYEFCLFALFGKASARMSFSYNIDFILHIYILSI